MARSSFFREKKTLLYTGAVTAVLAVTFGVALKDILPGAGGYSSAASADSGANAQGVAVASVAPEEGRKAEGVPALGAAPQSAPATGQPGLPVPGRFHVKRVLKIDGPLRHGDYHWDDKGVPAGPIVITVDLKAQTLSVFRDGYEIGVAVILYGATDKPSPVGVFPITEKDADHVSNLYDAPMPYMLRLTNDGVAIHGSNVQWGEATHGCIGVPTAFAKKLFGVARLGDIVIITDGKMMDMG